MNKFLPLIAFCVITIAVKAQQTIPVNEPYGKFSKEDLEMKSCDFEKDANAEILIHTADVSYDQRLNIQMDCHESIKIFNDNGKNVADIRIPFFKFENAEYIGSLEGETINVTDGKVEITKLDKKLVYTQVVDKYFSELVFTMPNVKAGSIIEYKYTFNSKFIGIPAWYFQDRIPVRYSEFNTHIPEYFIFSSITHMRTPYTLRTTSTESNSRWDIQQEKRVLVNVPSLPDEPFMSSTADNLEGIRFYLTGSKPPEWYIVNYLDTWKKIGDYLVQNIDFGKQVKRKLTGEEAIINTAKALKTDDEKIAYVFNTVKNTMKWDGYDEWYTIDGTAEAWAKKTGNSTEINLILCHLLEKSGVKNVMPMLVSTRNHGKVNKAYTALSQFNRAVTYIPVYGSKDYVLDATNKYNLYNETPYNLLNSSGLFVDLNNELYDFVFLEKTESVNQAVFVNAEIKPDGKIEGTAQISSYDYNRIKRVTNYKTDGEKKYIDYLRNDDNNLKISALKLENLETDTLPLVQNVDFKQDLTGSDDNYIYFNPNLFTSLNKNPFLNEKRNTDIDFGYLDNVSLQGLYKVPAGYKVDAMPKSISMTTPDSSIAFKRIVNEEDGTIAVRYVVSYKRSIYFKEDYAEFHEFLKKMYEMLNEQIVLKKS